MANIFTLNDNIEEIQDKIDLDDLYEKKRQQDLNNLELFNKVLNKIHQKIKKTSTLFKDMQHCWYVIPEVMLGIPNYDQGQCIGYVVEKLRENGFNIRYFHPNTVLISWNHWIPSYVRTEIKKKTNKNIDGYGNIIIDKKEGSSANEEINNIFDLKSNKTNEKTDKNRDYKSTDSYKPSGKFIYNSDYFKLNHK